MVYITPEIQNQSSQQLGAASKQQKASKGSSDNPRNENYVLIVMEVMQKFGLGPLEKLMEDMAKIEQLLAKFQGDLTQIQQFLSEIENAAHSDGSDPSNFNGLPKNFWKEHGSDLKQFMNEIKSIFFAGGDKSNPTLGDLMKEFGGSSSDLMNYFKKIAGEFNNPKDPSQNIITTNPNQHVSMIQLLVFLKLQLAVDQKQMTGAKMPSDLTKLYDPNGSGSGDGMIKSLMTFFNQLGTDVTAKNSKNSLDDGNILQALKSGDMDHLRGLFNCMAYNYYWSQNPNGSGDYPGEGGHDVLSLFYSDSQSSASLISSNTSENSTSMQEYTSEVSQYQNIGQNMIKANSESAMAVVNNYKTG